VNAFWPLGKKDIEKTVGITYKTVYHRKKCLTPQEKLIKSMILEPTVQECIETIAKKQYWSLVRQYGRMKGIDEALEHDVEILKKFLEEADIGLLRRETEERLSRNESPQVLIQLDKQGNLKVRVR